MILFHGFLGSRRIHLWVLFGAAFLLSPLSLQTNAHSAQVTLAWDANTEPEITGYKIYYGTSSRSYPHSVDVGNRSSCTVTNLLEGTTYYFAATDYNGIGQESAFSNEIVYTTPRPVSGCTYSISPTAQSFSPSGGSGTVTVTAGSACAWTAVSNSSWIIVTSNSSGSGTGTVNYSVSANAGTASRTGTLTIAGNTVTISQAGSSAGGVVFAMNSGGSGYVDRVGVTYQADQYYNGGWTYSSSAEIAGTEDAPLYQTERYGNFSYSIPLPNGNYTVVLRFAELYWSAAGQRVFDVYVEGTKVISNLDIFARVGKNRAYDVSLPVTITDGRLDISFQAIADYGKVSAILVTQAIQPVRGVVFAVNSGGPQYTHSDGTVYLSDRYYSGGTTWISSEAISGTTDDPLYQSERCGNFSYSIPLPNGNYTVSLKFAEIWWSSSGQRVFDVFIEGTKVISNLDIFALVGKNYPYVVSFPATVNDGRLDLSFRALVDDAKVSAIAVLTR